MFKKSEGVEGFEVYVSAAVRKHTHIWRHGEVQAKEVWGHESPSSRDAKKRCAGRAMPVFFVVGGEGGWSEVRIE